MEKLVFLNECAVDDCYEKQLNTKHSISVFCEKHKAKLDAGETLTAFYGKKIKKKVGAR